MILHRTDRRADDRFHLIARIYMAAITVGTVAFAFWN